MEKIWTPVHKNFENSNSNSFIRREGGGGGFQVCCYTLNKKLDCKIQITVNKNFNLKSAINIFSIKRQYFQF